jgi:O-antigen ligase
MQTVFTLFAQTAVFAFALWLSLRIFSSNNSDNSPGTAVFLGIIFALVSTFGGGGYFVFLPLIGLFYILIQFYGLGLIKSFCVVAMMGLISMGVGVIMEKLSQSVVV